MSYNKNKFEHNLKKAKRQRINDNDILSLNNIFSGHSKTLIKICNPKINE
tara:strand:+ start:86 stop:235 length:150 start_codon:yes stop_codon:yes gene_type:complete